MIISTLLLWLLTLQKNHQILNSFFVLIIGFVLFVIFYYLELKTLGLYCNKYESASLTCKQNEPSKISILKPFNNYILIWFIIKYSPLILNFSPFCNLFAFLIQLIWWFEYSEALDSTIHRMIALVPASNIGVSGWNVINGCSKVWKTILEKKYLKIIKLKII